MTIEKKLVTPTLAEHWLDGPTKNRPISDVRIQMYAQAMRKGEWQYNPADAICFDTDGRLINAQHRLWAVVESEISQYFLVVTDVDPEAQDVMDQGYRRTAGQQLSIDNVPFPKETAAIARQSILWHEGRLFGNTIVRTVTIAEVREWITKVDEVSLTKAIEHTTKIRRQYKLAFGPLGSVLYEAFTIDSNAATEFATKMETQMGVGEKDPIYQFGRYMQRQAVMQRTHSVQHQLWLVINCWTNWRAGKEVGKIMSPSDLTMSNFHRLK